MPLAPHLLDIFDVMIDKKYLIFNNKRGYDLNVVGIRSNNNKANTFNDWMVVFYVYEHRWQCFSFPITTDPGIYYREHPMNINGTAIVVPGQYRGLWKLGKHKDYDALIQKSEISVYRDNNIDNILDTNVSIETGMFGINCHRTNKNITSKEVNKYSAGCQVFQDSIHFDFLLTLCQKSSIIYGNSFSYTLLEENDF